ncbi:hypothetical protein [Saccharolobus islandicus]|uniref:Uncharacterized protein n=1 Tax=Saccharolobus islandicus (strain M.16.27) TaxID=427318 RepID=C3N5Z1_SACI3|nr:hypothetical protein [Sulfolobus islandicus]ACP55416.1 hypothetical protein M1627_1533 [Sulfolobus islandicus M.16.27]
MSAPTPNPNQSIPSQPPKKKINPRAIFFILIIVAAVGYLIAIHHTSTLHNTEDVKPNNNNNIKISNFTVPALQNIIAYNFSLTNSMQNNEIISRNGTIYFQISGYFNQFPNSYPQYLSGKIYIIYLELTIYNGSRTVSVILPVFATINYNKQQYFVYEAQGNIQQLQQLAVILKPNDFIAIEFYTNTSITIQGYTVW